MKKKKVFNYHEMFKCIQFKKKKLQDWLLSLGKKPGEERSVWPFLRIFQTPLMTTVGIKAMYKSQ